MIQNEQEDEPGGVSPAGALLRTDIPPTGTDGLFTPDQASTKSIIEGGVGHPAYPEKPEKKNPGNRRTIALIQKL